VELELHQLEKRVYQQTDRKLEKQV